MKKYRNPSKWNKIIVVDKENHTICKYDINPTGKLRHQIKAQITSQKVKEASLIKLPKQSDLNKLPKQSDLNKQVETKNDELILTPIIEVFSIEISKPENSSSEDPKEKPEEEKD